MKILSVIASEIGKGLLAGLAGADDGGRSSGADVIDTSGDSTAAAAMGAADAEAGTGTAAAAAAAAVAAALLGVDRLLR